MTFVLVLLATLLVNSICSANLYKVYLTRESDNLYKDMYSSVYFKTNMCLNLGLEEAIFDDGKMELYFPQSRDNCMVERVLK